MALVTYIPINLYYSNVDMPRKKVDRELLYYYSDAIAKLASHTEQLQLATRLD